jgi:hypothetical protein
MLRMGTPSPVATKYSSVGPGGPAGPEDGQPGGASYDQPVKVGTRRQSQQYKFNLYANVK